MYIYIYIYKIHMYIYIYIHFELRFLQFHVESLPKCDVNPQPWVYHAHTLTTELSGRMMRGT